MTQLMDNPSAQGRISEIFNAYWAHLAGEGVEAEILDRFDHLDSQVVIDALNAHLDDTTPSNAGGRPVGSYPPTVADLQRHIQAADTQAWKARKDAKEAKLKRELSQESDRAAAATLERLNWRAELGTHQDKRDAVIAHLRQTQRLDFTQGIDREAFRPVQAALFETNSELALEDAAEIFRASRLPDASWTEVEEKRAKEFLKSRKDRTIEAPSSRPGMDGLARWPGLREG